MLAKYDAYTQQNLWQEAKHTRLDGAGESRRVETRCVHEQRLKQIQSNPTCIYSGLGLHRNRTYGNASKPRGQRGVRTR